MASQVDFQNLEGLSPSEGTSPSATQPAARIRRVSSTWNVTPSVCDQVDLNTPNCEQEAAVAILQISPRNDWAERT